MERYNCHSRTQGIALDKSGYEVEQPDRFEVGMIVTPVLPIDFTGKTGNLVVLRRIIKSDRKAVPEYLEEGQVAIDLSKFKKCFNRIMF